MSDDAVKKWLPAFISAAILGVFAIVGSTLVGLSYQGTVERIAQNERDALLRQMAAVLPHEQYDNELLNDRIEILAPETLGHTPTTVYRARKNGQNVAAIFSPVTTPGYAGDIVLLVGIYHDGSLAGVRVVAHKETPGLGDKIEEKRHPWITGFAGKSLTDPTEERWRVKRDGGHFDQFTGATITPRTVVAAVKRTLEYFRDHREQIFAQATQMPAADATQASGHG
jgi:electron transport complex protein RnfG